MKTMGKSEAALTRIISRPLFGSSTLRGFAGRREANFTGPVAGATSPATSNVIRSGR